MTEQRTISRTTYGFRDAETGALVRLRTERNGPNTDFCGEFRCSLSKNSSNPIFEVATLRDASVIRATDNQWYNSDHESPTWGDFKGGDGLLPVRFDVLETYDARFPDPVEIRSSVSEVDLPRAIFARRVTSQRPAKTVLAKRYFGVLPPEGTEGVVMSVVGVPADLAIEDLPDIALIESPGSRLLIGVVLDAKPIPEDYPAPDYEMDRLEEGQRAVLCLYDQWPSRPDPIDFASWERIEAPSTSGSPRP